MADPSTDPDTLYSSYAQVLSVCQSIKDDLEAILDPETGFAPRMRQICEDQLEDLSQEPTYRHGLADEIDLLRLEANTWGLLQALLPARKLDTPTSTPSSPYASAKALLSQNPYTPPSTLAHSVIQSSPLLQELIVVRDWLHETAPLPTSLSGMGGVEGTNGYWRYTKYMVMQGLRTGHGNNKDEVVQEMDPDAVNREGGGVLAPEDASSEKSLLQALFLSIRAGRLDLAVDLCRKANQPWRAACIRGSLVFQWGALSLEKKDDSDTDEEDNEQPGPGTYSGNLNRRLWKTTCIRGALSSSLPTPERILLASLSPSPQTLPILKGACKTWEDHLWAEIGVVCEDRVGRLSSVGGYWEGESVGPNEGGGGGRDGSEKREDREEEEDEEQWREEVVDVLESLKSVNVVEGQPANHPYHYSQLLIILDRTDQLIQSFAERLKSLSEEMGDDGEGDFEYTSLSRFFAHLCLFLQMVDIPVPPMACQTILERYLEVLEDAHQTPLIALYVSALGDNAVERYASFLVSLSSSLDVTSAERKQALARATEHGLDERRVAIRCAERSVERGLGMLPPSSPTTPLPSLVQLQPPPTEEETFLLRSIEWTTYMESTYEVALEQATVILRYFLGCARIPLALSLLPHLPDALSSIADPEEVATEYLHYRQFFVVWELVGRVVEWEGEGVRFLAGDGVGGQGGVGEREERAKWVGEYRALIDQVYDQIVKLLTTEWLISDVDNLDLDKRQRQLVRIRQIYIPELVLRLHHILYSSRKVIQGNLKRALELANIVADSRYRLYEDFAPSSSVSGAGAGAGFAPQRSQSSQGLQGGRTLPEYLGAVRQAVLAGLENGGSDAFRVVAGL